MKRRQRDSNTAIQPAQSDDGIGDTLVQDLIKGSIASFNVKGSETGSKSSECYPHDLRFKSWRDICGSLSEKGHVPWSTCDDMKPSPELAFLLHRGNWATGIIEP